MARTTGGVEAAADRIERLLDELHAGGDPAVAARAEELVRLVTDLYGAALEAVVDLTTAQAPDLLASLTGDELVAGLLAVHGLHPDSLRQRVEAALASVRPMLAAHAGDVELLDVDEAAAAVRLRLAGSCDGCPSSADTLRNAVEVAIRSAAPEVGIIDVDEPSSGVPVALGRKPAYEDCPVEVAAS